MADPTPARTSVDEFLATARSNIRRLSPAEALEEQRNGATIVDTRDSRDRAREGVIPGSIPVALSVLPWRADPDGTHTDDRINHLDARLIVVCNDGYSSSWAASVLVELGFAAAGDLAGGFRAWAREGMPVEHLDP